MASRRLIFAAFLSISAGCDDTDPNFPSTRCSDVDTPNCVAIAGGDSQALLDAANSLEPGTTIVLGVGTFALQQELNIANVDGTHIVGQGIDQTVLDFGAATTQVNGIFAVSDDFLVQDLTVLDAPKDGIRVEDSVGVVFRRIRATWSTPSDPTNGAYGIYPVRSSNVLVEDSRAENASDAGLYVGQCQNVIVRNNVVSGNVAGLEIENTQFADVYGNVAENNTGGIVVFDLPGNPIVGRDVRLRDNQIRNNNLANFAPGGSTVSQIPSGTGTFAMASRRVEITGNTYENNETVDVAIISGLVVNGNESAWELDESSLVGTWEDLGLLDGDTAGTITNFRSENIVVSGNSHSGSGTSPDLTRQLGLLMFVIFGSDPVASVIYDTLGESAFDASNAAANSNDNHVCVGGNTAGTFASLDVETQEGSPGSPILFLDTAPFAPFDCTALDGGPVAEVVLP